MAHWADMSAVVAGALDVLRLDATDADADRVEAAAPVAVGLIDTWLDTGDAPYTDVDAPPALMDCAIRQTVEIYRRGDAPFGQAGGWDATGPTVTLTTQIMAGIRAELLMYRKRWGMA